MLGEAFRAITALEQEGLSGCNLRQGPLQLARFTRKDEGRIAGELALDIRQGLLVEIDGGLLDGLGSPAVRAPAIGRHHRLHK